MTLKKYLMYLEAAPSLRCALFSPLTETDPAIGGMVEFHGE
jgi:hypothetical protein